MFHKLGPYLGNSLRCGLFSRSEHISCLSESFRNLSVKSDVNYYRISSDLTPPNQYPGANGVVACRLLKCSNDSAWSLTQKRYHWRPLRSVRTPPTKPLHFNYSGDLDMSIGNVDLKEPKLGYENVPELLEADENVKKIFSLEYSTRAEVVNKHVEELLDKVKDHPLDIQSLEVKIARETIRIRCGIKHCLRFRNDKVSKSALIELIHKRKGHLRKLQMQDIDKFNWLEKELRIKFVEDKKHNRRPTKRGLRRKAARDAANAQVQNKLAQLQTMLKTERIKFDKFKEAELADIERNLKELGVSEDDTTSLERTLTAIGHADLIPRKVPYVSRRRLLLQKKFALYAPRKKERDTEILHAHDFLTPEELSHYTDLKN